MKTTRLDPDRASRPMSARPNRIGLRFCRNRAIGEMMEDCPRTGDVGQQHDLEHLYADVRRAPEYLVY